MATEKQIEKMNMKTIPGKLMPAPFTSVRIDDRFWKPRREINRKRTLALEYKHCKETGRLDAWNWKPGMPNEPHIFWDSDVGKWIEAAAYTLALQRNAAIEKKIDAITDDMAKNQLKDGYLNSHYIKVEPAKRWTNLRDNHELYCAGHLIEGAVAYYQATGKRKLLDVVSRYADCIDKTFGPKRGQKRGYCGHPEIELALVKLAQATGCDRYLKLAEFFINERGRKPSYFDLEAKTRKDKRSPASAAGHAYVQAHKPLRDQDVVVGHSVRAMYIYSGMADVAAHNGDKRLITAMKRLWNNLTTKRMHVTGGIGPTCRNEGFTFDYDLPNENAYNETCANIALVFWAHRMLHMDPDGRYADVMERALYNSVISGVSMKGDTFFYANPLAAHPGIDPHGSIRDASFHYRRSPWFGCACCPPNIARLLASLGGYMYSTGRSEIRVHLYAAGSAILETAGTRVVLRQETEYPRDGRIALTVNPDSKTLFSVALRIPGWCRGATIHVNGRSWPCTASKGYVTIRREWKKGDKIVLHMPMPVERIEANPHVRQDAGRIALQRGPVVYCLEEVDNCKNLNDLVLPGNAPLRTRFEPRLLGGVVTITGKALRRMAWNGSDLYSTTRTPMRTVPIKAVPYATWGNRAPGEMIVWLQDSACRLR
jgi:uncharacterized protein